MKKTIITGTGRAGTSFLVHLLSALGMDTGYTEEECFEICNNECQAGAEWTIEKPYKILKNPEFMVKIEEIILNNDIKHVIIPIRNLEKSAKSRVNNAENHGGFGGYAYDSHNQEEQEANNARLFYEMIEVLTEYEIPYTTIAFPRMVKDSLYLHNKLREIFYNECDNMFNNSKYTIEFYKTYNRIADTNKITF